MDEIKWKQNMLKQILLKIDKLLVCQFIRENSRFNVAEMRGVKTSASLNLGIISQYATYLAKKGINGILVKSTSGETSMSVAERKFVAEAWVKATKRTTFNDSNRRRSFFRYYQALHMGQFLQSIDYKIPSFVKSLQIKS
ncbi:uncharacterized protein LOC115240052 isoform X2 [Formica exsecta]|uniref:uncharacterized protein LOC115240052 isoform X2 n=1 Tax=Formica exsecta TaxID=72781 RepID=UPI0011433E3A|nr:uncharacterized protein LOC115240052 isoform X2 [Formica exsecta]